MLSEVKKCVENNDIKGLRYIFVDCLDVDPTFEKYKEDYNYCKSINGFFDTFVEINPLISDKNRWNMKYWEQLKLDLIKNFSSKRFEHMVEVAKVVYADKISRLLVEREHMIQKTAVANKPKESVVEDKESKKMVGSSQVGEVTNGSVQTTQYISKSEMAKRDLAEKIRLHELEEQKRNEKIEQDKAERIARSRKLEDDKKYNAVGGNESKKLLGVVIVAIIIVVVVLMIVL